MHNILISLAISTPVAQVATHTNTPSLEELYPLVQEWISKEMLHNWLTIYPVAQVRQGIQYTLNQLKKGTKISNVGGYLRKMIGEKDLQDTATIEKVKRTKARDVAKKKQQKKASLELQYKQLQRELSDKENRFVDRLFEEQPDLKFAMIERAKGKRMSGYDPQMSVDENLKKPMFLAAVRSVTIELYSSKLKELYAEYHPLIKQAKKALEQA